MAAAGRPAVGRTAAAPAASATAPAAIATPGTASTAAPVAASAAAAAWKAGTRLRLRGLALRPRVAAGGLEGVRRARGWRRTAPVAGSGQAGQAQELLALTLHLPLEGGELA